jgi:hypothetical protein
MFVYVGIAGLSYQFFTNAILQTLVAVAGPVAPSALGRSCSARASPSCSFSATSLGYWIDHFLKHRIPALWELHKVHHTAEVLTPLTTFRMHPLDTFIFGHILAMTAAVANGLAAYAFGDTTYQYALPDQYHLVAFIHLYVHLQHTHVWDRVPRRARTRVLKSRASSNSPLEQSGPFKQEPGQLPCAVGLAVWHAALPAGEREQLTFGVEPAYVDAQTINGEFLAPFGRAFNVTFGWMRRKPLRIESQLN